MLRWAIGEHISNAEQPELQNPAQYSILWLDIRRAFALSCKGRGIDLDSPTYRHERRAKQVQEHVDSGGWLDPTELRKIGPTGCLKFEGRHRLLIAHRCGETHAPFSVPKEIIADLSLLFPETIFSS
jgi:hypothetical protein